MVLAKLPLLIVALPVSTEIELSTFVVNVSEFLNF